MIIDDARVGEQLASVAADLESRLAELSSDIQDVIERDIPLLRGDRLVSSLLEASIGENVGTLTHMLPLAGRGRSPLRHTVSHVTFI